MRTERCARANALTSDHQLRIRSAIATGLSEQEHQLAEEHAERKDWRSACIHEERAIGFTRLAITCHDEMLRREIRRIRARPTKEQSAGTASPTPTATPATAARRGHTARTRSHKPRTEKKPQSASSGDDSDPPAPDAPALTFVAATGGRSSVEAQYTVGGRRLTAYASPTGFVFDLVFGGHQDRAPIALWDAVAADLAARLIEGAA